jgi:hypothetical protein
MKRFEHVGVKGMNRRSFLKNGIGAAGAATTGAGPLAVAAPSSGRDRREIPEQHGGGLAKASHARSGVWEAGFTQVEQYQRSSNVPTRSGYARKHISTRKKMYKS